MLKIDEFIVAILEWINIYFYNPVLISNMVNINRTQLFGIFSYF